MLAGLAGAAGAVVLGTSSATAGEGSGSAETGKVTAKVLGTAQDGGVPHAGCRKQHCEAARRDPQLRRRSPCLALLDGNVGQAFLIDAGPDLPAQLYDLPAAWGEPRRPVGGIMLTHAHVGHYAGLLFLGRAVMGCDRVPVLCSRQMAAFLGDNAPWSLLVELGNIVLRTIEPGRPIRLTPSLTVEPLPVPHRAEYTDTLAYLVSGPRRRLLFLPDIDRWQGLQPALGELVGAVDVALLDGTFYSPEELPGRDMSKIPHPPISQTIDLLQAAADRGDREIVFIHLNHSNLLLDGDGRRLAQLRARGYDIAEEGMEIAL